MKNKNKPVIIAEACQNHNGDLSVLKEMIYAAKEAGADYIKIQSMLAEEISQRERFEEGVMEEDKVKSIKRPYQAEYDRLKSMDLDDKAHVWFIDECKKAGIKPMTTAFTLSRIKFLASLAWDEIKVASYDCASLLFLAELKKNFKHIYLSTGAVYDSEIEAAADLLKDVSFSFLHCVTIYPTPLDQLHLKRMDWLRSFTPSVGFSDHSLVKKDHLKASFAALYYGANIIERHFTVLKPEESRDGPVSINPAQLKELVDFSHRSKEEQKEYVDKNIPEYASALGSAHRELSETELLNRDYYRGRFVNKMNGKTFFNWEENHE